MKESQPKKKSKLSSEEFFLIPKIKRIIEIVQIISNGERNQFDLVFNFKIGLFLHYIDPENNKEEIKDCFNPVNKLIVEYFKWDKYQKTLIEKVIPGDETVPGTQVPVSVNGLLKFMDNYKAYTGKEIEFPLIPKDVIPIVTEFIQVKKKQFADDNPAGITQLNQETKKEALRETKANPEVEQSNDFDSIIYRLFDNINENEVSIFKNKLDGKQKDYPLNLLYKGSKRILNIETGKLLKLDYDRRTIAFVFSNHCKWKRTATSTPEELDEKRLYKDIGNMR